MILYACLKWVELHKKRGSTREEWEAHLHHLRYGSYESLEWASIREGTMTDNDKENASIHFKSG